MPTEFAKNRADNERVHMLNEELSEYWKKVVNTIQEGVMIVTPDGVIVSANRAMLEMTGFSNDELIGQFCSRLNCSHCQVEREQGSAHWCRLFRNGYLNRQRCVLTTKDGRQLQILKNASVLRDPEGQVIGAVETITDISELLEKEGRIEAFKRELLRRDTFHGMVGHSTSMQKVFSLIEAAADSDAPVIIYGESGTGKELAARAVHEISSRKEQPYVKVNCAALNENLLESELFGHVKGAFTNAIHDRKGRFEAAENGSIFLDEIGDMPLSTQVKLLRVLEEKMVERVGDNRSIPINVRIITATNRDLRQMIGEERFREDFFYRINVIPIMMPPLRQRRGDIPILAEAFFRNLSLKSDKPIKGISPAAMDLLMRYDWPGNIRELRSSFEYAFVTCRGESIQPEDLPVPLADRSAHSAVIVDYPHPQRTAAATEKKSIAQKEGAASAETIAAFPVPFSRRTGEEQKKALLKALEATEGNQLQAANLLGVSRVTVWKWMKRFGISAEKTIRHK
jgi:two-component system response regulator HydG